MLSMQARPFLCQHGLAHMQASLIPCKDGTVHRLGKSTVQMLLLFLHYAFSHCLLALVN